MTRLFYSDMRRVHGSGICQQYHVDVEGIDAVPMLALGAHHGHPKGEHVVSIDFGSGEYACEDVDGVIGVRRPIPGRYLVMEADSHPPALCIVSRDGDHPPVTVPFVADGPPRVFLGGSAARATFLPSTPADAREAHTRAKQKQFADLLVAVEAAFAAGPPGDDGRYYVEGRGIYADVIADALALYVLLGWTATRDMSASEQWIILTAA